MTRVIAFFFFCLLSNPILAQEKPLGLAARQMIVCLAPDHAASEGKLQLFQRDETGAWQSVSEAWPVLFSRGGLAWGRGLNPVQPGPQKQTGDHRNPAGLFALGQALGYAPDLPDGAKGWPYHQVTEQDAWIDDASLAHYNHLVTFAPGETKPEWFEREKMHLGDEAYRWMLVIEHNYLNPVPHAGDCIFFHVRRGTHYHTAGCTTMEEDKLKRILVWLEPDSHAMLAELAWDDYGHLWQAWHLPPPEKVAAYQSYAPLASSMKTPDFIHP